MPFKKGNPGRPKGSKNRNTEAIKEAYTLLLHGNLDNLTKWVGKVAEENPEKAFYMLANLNEFVLPKLARTDADIKIKEDISSTLKKIYERNKLRRQGLETEQPL